MTRKIFGCLVLIFLALAFSCFANGRQSEGAQPPSGIREIPFEIVNGHFIEVRGSIGSLVNLHFLVEVGTPRTMLDPQLGRREDDSRTQEKQPVPVFAPLHSEVLLKDFSLGSVPMPEIRAISTDLDQMPAVPRGTAGIVGLDILRRQNV